MNLKPAVSSPHLSHLLMPSLRHYSSLVGAIDRQLHRLSTTTSSFPSTPKMKIGKAPEILKKAAATLKSKTGVLGARLLVLVSLRRRMATVGAISHRIHALVVADRDKARPVDSDKALVLRKATATGEKLAVHGGEIVHLSELALFDNQEDDDGGSPDWTHSLFNDDDNCCCYTEEYDDDGDDDDHGVLLDACNDDDEDEPSVMDVIRSNREDEGLEFNMDDEIDQAADMFIRRFRKRMNRSF